MFLKLQQIKLTTKLNYHLIETFVQKTQFINL
jgi:hypothetical protein